MDLIVEDGEVWGASGFRNGNQVSVFADAVLLANGGAGAIFPHNINHPFLSVRVMRWLTGQGQN